MSEATPGTSQSADLSSRHHAQKAKQPAISARAAAMKTGMVMAGPRLLCRHPRACPENLLRVEGVGYRSLDVIAADRHIADPRDKPEDDGVGAYGAERPAHACCSG